MTPKTLSFRGRRLVSSGIAVLLSACMSVSAVAQTASTIQSGTILASIQNSESGGYGSSAWSLNTGNNHYGAFQQGNQALQQIGYENSDGTWNAQKSGAASLSDYLNCSSCQIAGEEAYLSDNWSQAESNGLVSTYLGQTGADGNVYNESAILECTNYFGASGCASYISGNYTSGVAAAVAANPHIAADIAAASETDSSAITGSNTIVDNSANATGGTVSSATATAQMMTYCAQQVQQFLNEAGAQEVDRQTALASSKDFGYTLMDGNGILDDASATGDSGSGFSALSQLGYAAKSCLSNLLSQISGIATIFTLPDLSSLLSQVINMACSMAESELSQTMQPLYEKVSDLNNMGYVGGGGFMPGLQLFNASAGSGGTGGLLQLNTGSSTSNIGSFQSLMNGDSSWYMNSSGDGSDKIFDYSSSANSQLGTAGLNPFN